MLRNFYHFLKNVTVCHHHIYGLMLCKIVKKCVTCSKIFSTIKRCFLNDFDEKPRVSRCDIIGCPFWFYAFLNIWSRKKLCAYQSLLRRIKPIHKINFCFDIFLKWLDNWLLKFFCFPCHTVTFGAWHNGIQPQIFKIIYHNPEIMIFERPIIIPVR